MYLTSGLYPCIGRGKEIQALKFHGFARMQVVISQVSEDTDLGGGPTDYADADSDIICFIRLFNRYQPDLPQIQQTTVFVF